MVGVSEVANAVATWDGMVEMDEIVHTRSVRTIGPASGVPTALWAYKELI